MLKRYFISMLGALTAIWISFMLVIVLCMAFAIGSIASAFNQAKTVTDVGNNSVLRIDLNGSIDERGGVPDIYNLINEMPQPQSLSNIVDAINAARSDRRISGIYLNCVGSSAGIATREAIRNALAGFSKSGKWIVAYGDAYTQGDYYLATAADEVYLNPVGMIDIRGLASGVPFFKGLLDKVGVEMQVVKVGTFKSAVEPYVLTHMSDANRLQMHTYLDNIWNCLAKSMSDARGIPLQEFNALADSVVTYMPAEQLVDLKLVDGLKYTDEMQAYLKGKLGEDEDDEIDFVTVDQYLASDADVPHMKKEKHKIAVYYAYGDITENGKDGIASDRVVPDILELAENDDIDAMVLRVNSGGGSAFASEQIWHALEVFKSKGKTFYVSMGDYAASGGYYISCGAEKIYAEPTTLTGSIGIFGMIPCVKELMTDKLGVNIDFVQTNANSTGVTTFEPMDAFQRYRMQGMINRGYELFTQRCADGRHMSQDSIKAIAEGRVWDGMTAQKIGLVDNLGSLTSAIDALAKSKGYSKYQIVNYPEIQSNFLNMLLQLDANMRTEALRNELGAYYPAYEHIRNLKEMDPVQARMEVVIVE